MAVVERTKKMNAIKLKKGDDPEELFELIKSMENQFSDLPQKLTENKKIAAIFKKTLDNYGIILANTARDKVTGITFDNLEKSMKMQWRIVSGSKNSNAVQGKEFALAGFNGKCYKCGQVSHRANKCPNAKSNQTNNGSSGGEKKFSGK